ncbi:thiamine pyrophosphate-dependent enzyme [Leucobacter sp. HY1910]
MTEQNSPSALRSTPVAALHAGGDPAPIRFLDAAGAYAPSDTAAEYAAELEGVGVDDFKQWYVDMAWTRAFDTECTHLQRQGQLALWVPSVGQEGCQVGIAHATAPQDHVFPAYREHTVAKVRGVPFEKVASLFRGVTHGGWDVTDPAHGNFHQYTLVLGSQTQHATGYALGQVLDAKMRALAAGDSVGEELEAGEAATVTGEATVVFYGDGTSSQGDPNEAMVFAASYQTPELFVVQNNGWAISVPVARQSRTPLYRRALGFGLRAVQIDGNDPLAAFAVSRRFLRLAREGGGPAYIEALTYRIGAHTTSDDPTRYREKAELEEWQQRDPLMRLEVYLRSLGVTDEFFAETHEAADREAKRVRDAILTLPKPAADDMFAHVYSESHPRIEEQREWLARYEASFEDQEAGA